MMAPKPLRVLDVGCFCGGTGRWLKTRFADVYMIGIEFLAAAAAQLADRNFTVEQHLCAGNPAADVVIEQARLMTAEVIVMGHHHLSRLRRWSNPSTCGEVIERSRCPVLIDTQDDKQADNPSGLTVSGVTTTPSPYDGQFLDVHVTAVQ